MRRREWRPPPGWPEPPAGFTPRPGWEPDTSWPPAPDEWQFWRWRSAPRTPRQRLRLAVVFGLAGLAVASIIGLLSVAKVLNFNLPDGATSVTNETPHAIRLTGNCVPDDPQTLEPGDTDTDVYAGADCVVDNGDGVDGILGCLSLRAKHTDLTMLSLREITSPNDCSAAGSR